MAEGYKAWSGGQVLDAGDLTDYASSQAVMRFANAAGRDAALTVGIVKEGMAVYLKDTNVVQVNTDGSITGWVQIYPVITAGITDAQVTNAKLATNSVASANIIDATIVGGDIASGTITGSNIASATIASSNIIDGTIVGNDIAGSTISGSNIGSATITGSNIAAGTITGSNIQDGTITSADLAAGVAVANIGYTPIQQGGGDGQLNNKLYIGWNGSANLLLRVDSNNFGSTWPININGTAADSALLDGYNTNTAASTDTIPVRNNVGRINATGFVTDDSSPNQFYNSGTHTQIGQFCARVVNASTVYSEAVTSARTVLINSAGTLGTSVSSRRYKIDIETLQADTDKILQLDPVTFYYLPEMYEPDQDRVLEVGLIAEQAAELGLEQLVHRNPAGEPEGIAYEKLAVYLLKVCQTQQTQIDALSARLDKIGA